MPRKINAPKRPDGYSHKFLNYAVGQSFGLRNVGEDVTEIVIYDVIGDSFGEGVSAKRFRDELNNITTPNIRLLINSPGGDVFDGIAIYNDLVDHPANVEVHITGLAASAASLIAMAGDSIEMAENALMMIHNAWVMAIGDKNALREVANVLDKIDMRLADTYESRTGLDAAAITQMMDEETWMDSEEAFRLGFVDRQSEEEPIEAAFDLSVFAHAPDSLKQQMQSVMNTAKKVQNKNKHKDSDAATGVKVQLGLDSTEMQESLKDIQSFVDKLQARIRRLELDLSELETRV